MVSISNMKGNAGEHVGNEMSGTIDYDDKG
jgi:hypothetical protein